jgi:hypothetical protein
MRPIIIHAVAFGLVLGVVLGALLLVVGWANAEIMLNDYPPDIKAKWGPMSERTKRQRVFVAAGFLIAIVAVVAWSLQTLPAFVARELTFASAFVYFTTMFGTFNVFDWLVIDWGLVYWQPRFLVLPGTEGMAGYQSYWFHFRGFLIGIPIVVFGSALAAALVSLILRTSGP